MFLAKFYPDFRKFRKIYKRPYFIFSLLVLAVFIVLIILDRALGESKEKVLSASDDGVETTGQVPVSSIASSSPSVVDNSKVSSKNTQANSPVDLQSQSIANSPAPDPTVEIKFAVQTNVDISGSLGTSFEIYQAGAKDQLKGAEIVIPAGWFITKGDSIGEGVVVGSGTVLFAGNFVLKVQIKNINNINKHWAIWRISIVNDFKTLQSFESFIDKKSDGGFVWNIARSPFTEIALPATLELVVFKNLSGGKAIIGASGDFGISGFNLTAQFLNGTTQIIEAIPSL